MEKEERRKIFQKFTFAILSLMFVMFVLHEIVFRLVLGFIMANIAQFSCFLRKTLGPHFIDRV